MKKIFFLLLVVTGCRDAADAAMDRFGDRTRAYCVAGNNGTALCLAGQKHYVCFGNLHNTDALCIEAVDPFTVNLGDGSGSAK